MTPAWAACSINSSRWSTSNRASCHVGPRRSPRSGLDRGKLCDSWRPTIRLWLQLMNIHSVQSISGPAPRYRFYSVDSRGQSIPESGRPHPGGELATNGGREPGSPLHTPGHHRAPRHYISNIWHNGGKNPEIKFCLLVLIL